MKCISILAVLLRLIIWKQKQNLGQQWICKESLIATTNQKLKIDIDVYENQRTWGNTR